MSRRDQSHDAEFIALQEALAGEYSLDREIGRGGMGIVYLAREVRLARSVAIKVLPPRLAERADLRSAFLRESQTVAGLNHPNIVPVYAVGERAGFVYIVMAFVDGITLGEHIRTRGPLLPGQGARMLREVAWALAYAHSAGIVHRDVSAENIVLERGTNRSIVMDFGIASAMQTTAISDDGRVMGNPHYISPEQAVGEPVDARSDLYSLGVCGFYALTGRLPFDAGSVDEIIHLHLTAPAPSIARFAHTVPSRLAQAVERCLAKEPASRFRSAEAFAEAIDLAFEHAKEIPAALRVWIQHGQREVGPRALLILLGALGGSLLAVTYGNPFLVPLCTAAAIPIGLVPVLTRLRRVLRDGYVVDDLHSALREYNLIRSEELLYEQRGAFAGLSPALRIMLLGSITSMGILSWMVSRAAAGGFLNAEFSRSTFMLAAICAVVSTVGAGGQFLAQRMVAPMAELKVRFWKSKWAERLATIAGVGLDVNRRPALGMRMLTEVALGRATDHLYQALPKSVRRALSELPDTVRRLEEDATRLRATIDTLDERLASFERRALRGAARAESVLEADFRDARRVAAERLAATVSALETIRLDLLRLQIGSGGIDSVTASLAAAQRVGEQIAQAVDAQAEVERFLQDAQPRTFEHMSEHVEQNQSDDDDADTPVSGVPAAHV